MKTLPQGLRSYWSSRSLYSFKPRHAISTNYIPTRSQSTNQQTRLNNRTCMITGGTSGIGYAIAERFLTENAARVILVGRSGERLLDAGRRLQSRAALQQQQPDSDVATRAPEEDHERQSPTDGSTGQRQNGDILCLHERISLLVGDVGEAGSWMRELEREMESVEILINAAGISPSALLAKTDPSEISRTLQTNLEGAILTSRALLRASMRSRVRNRKAAGDGPVASKCIINVSSLLAEKGGMGVVPYAASKAGLLGLTRAVTVEAGGLVRCNAIVPGYIDTPMIADFSEGETARLKESIPLRRFGHPAEVADAAVFLAQNEYANNCVLNLDGGLSAV